MFEGRWWMVLVEVARWEKIGQSRPKIKTGPGRGGGRPASVLVTKPDWVGLNVGPALVCCVVAFELTFSLNQPLKPGHMEVQRTRTRIDSYESHPEKRDLFTIHTWSLK